MQQQSQPYVVESIVDLQQMVNQSDQQPSPPQRLSRAEPQEGGVPLMGNAVFFNAEDVLLARRQSPAEEVDESKFRTGVPEGFFSTPIEPEEFFPPPPRVLSARQGLVVPEAFISEEAAEQADRDEPPNLRDPVPDTSRVQAFIAEVLEQRDVVCSKRSSPAARAKWRTGMAQPVQKDSDPVKQRKAAVIDTTNWQVPSGPHSQPYRVQSPIRTQQQPRIARPPLGEMIHIRELNIETLDLSGLGLDRIPDLSEHEAHALQAKKIGMLVQLDVSRNGIMNLKGLPAWVDAVDASDSGLQTLEGLHEGVKRVYARNCRLDVPLRVPRGVELLDVSRSEMRKLEVYASGLETLIADRCGVVELGVLPAGLRKLHLQNNFLNSFPPALLPLEDLNLENNQIDRLEFLPRSLQRLSVRGNPLQSIADVRDMVLQTLEIDEDEAEDSELRRFAELVNSGEWRAETYSTSTQYYMDHRALFEQLTGDELDKVCRMLGLKYHPKLNEILVRRGLRPLAYMPEQECGHYAYRTFCAKATD